MKFFYIFFTLIFIFPINVYSLSVDSVVTSDWLKIHLHAPGLKVIEMSDEASYEFKGHIPGARFTNKSDWRYQSSDGSLVHHDSSKLQTMIKDLGINDADAVVVYYKGTDLNEVLGSHYLFWLFHYLGHTNVAMLDQGWHGWLMADGLVDEDPTEITKGDFIARPLTSLELTTDELYVTHDHYTLVDGRPASHFAGRTKFGGNTRFGRIAGSVSQPWEDYLQQNTEGLLYIDMSVIPPLLTHGMITQKQPLLLTCFGGTGAAVNYVLFYKNGYQNIRLHDEGLRRWNARFLPLVRNVQPLISKGN